MAKIELGDTAKDKVSGFKGVVVSITRFLNGCDRYSLQPKIDPDGKLPDEKWFDDKQLDLVRSVKRVVTDPPVPLFLKTGGPQGSMPQRAKVERRR